MGYPALSDFLWPDAAQGRQPQGPLILDWTNPLTQHIAAIVNPATGEIWGRTTHDPFGAFSGTSMRMSPGIAGVGVDGRISSTNAYRLNATANQFNTAWESPTTQGTWAAVVFKAGDQANGNAPIFGNQSPSTSPYTAWSVYDIGGNGHLAVECATSGAVHTLQAGTIDTGALNILVGRYDGAALTAFKNGVLQGSLACSGTLTYPNSSDRGPAVGNFYNYTSAQRSFNGFVFLAVLWDAAISQAEIASFSANPWQLFATPESISFAAASGGGGTAVSPGVGSIALTGYAPTLAQTANVALVPGTGSVAITGYAPAVTQGGSLALVPGVGSIAITGYAPTIAQPHAVAPGAGSLALTGYAPAVVQNENVAPGVGSLALTGYAPTVAQTANQGVAPAAGTLAISGYAPTVTQVALSQSLVPGVGTLTITGYAPTVAQTGQQKNSAGFPYKKLPRMVWESPPRTVIVPKVPDTSEVATAAAPKSAIAQTIERAKMPVYTSPFTGVPTRISSLVRRDDSEDEEEELLLLV